MRVVIVPCVKLKKKLSDGKKKNQNERKSQRMYSKLQQTGKFGRKARLTKKTIVALKCTESQLQKQCNDLLDAHHIKYLRIPDWIWSWLKLNAPVQVVKELSGRFGGMPDNMCIRRINDKYNLLMAVELKIEKGKLHGKQKNWYKEIAVQISRTPEETIAKVNDFMVFEYFG
jgi:ribosomal protein L44E